ncbi:sulfotransferase domain-containing protein [Bosea sp. (in: a-proteobacteria)]|uniref:sulfotransferase domain-containing protein n=1 Tax=Bosea sp. (in: a-proteobacteria) TaxID=1871050 RepID=UPI003F727FAA
MNGIDQNRKNLIVTQGIYRSASTWVFNIVLCLLRHRNIVISGYADDISNLQILLDQYGETFVVKSHIPTEEAALAFHFHSGKIVVTVRDPLDCVASLMRQFYMGFDESLDYITKSASATLRLVEMGSPLILRYETDTRGSDTVKKIANHVQLEISDQLAQQMAQQFAPENVRSEIDQMLTKKSFDGKSPRIQFDAETHWHARHVGQGISNYFDDQLIDAQIQKVKSNTTEFCSFFRYGDLI